jgi:hypothetical protein
MGFSMFMREGGWGMWPILLFGLGAVAAAVRYARRPQPAHLAFAAGMLLTVLSATLHATWTAFGAVFGYLQSRQRVPDADFARILVEGLKESTRPGALGGLFVTLVLLVVSVGFYRVKVDG